MVAGVLLPTRFMGMEHGRECVGLAGFPALLIVHSLISRADLHIVQQHAFGEQRR